MSRVVVWGAGELGGRVARAVAAEGRAVVGATATTGRHAELRAAGVTPHLGPPALQADDRLLLALPGSERQIMAISALVGQPVPARAVLISSTGYYGTPSGAVHEDTAPGDDPHAALVASAEQAFRAWAGDRGVILRTGGLYRPGRGPLQALIRRGAPPAGPPDRSLALVHYDDAAAAAHAALDHPDPHPVYLSVTPPCPTREAFYTAACVLLDLPLPRFERPLRRPLAQYDVGRLRADLLPTPAHPRWQGALVPG
ncbi:MAG: hypothetical protein H6706_07760 [Myxococcales bacterium]|nr:hypothetical protein [Myxococcales bacterium]